MSEEKIELLDCPFCGGEAKVETRPFSEYPIRVICDECKNSTPWYLDYAEKVAIEQWNTRTTAELRERLELVESVLKASSIEILPDGSHSFSPKARKFYCEELTLKENADLREKLRVAEEALRHYAKRNRGKPNTAAVALDAIA